MIHIVSGQEMLNEANFYSIEGKILPFNEAMCEGNPSENLFESSFIDERIFVHQTTKNDYEKIVLSHLKTIKLDDKIELWFGYDMFCQMNLLTILAYLDKKQYQEEIKVHICDETKKIVLDVFTVTCLGFYAYYRKLLCNKIWIETPLTYLNQSIPLYFSYARKDKEVLAQLLRGTPKDANVLGYLMRTYKEYGLGDVQWKKWLESV